MKVDCDESRLSLTPENPEEENLLQRIITETPKVSGVSALNPPRIGSSNSNPSPTIKVSISPKN